jgi:nucleotide-binding universal stress UspA family protein
MSSNRPVVVCATDFSDRANHAADAAAKVAAGRSEPLLMVHVTSSRDREALAWVKERLQSEVERLVASGTPAESVLLEGDSPLDALLDFIQAERPALVVVASESKGPVDRWALGSFSEQLAQSSPVPTLVLRDPGPFRDWSWTGRSLKILAALDLKAGSESVLRWVKELGRSGPYDVVACHFNEIIPQLREDLQPAYIQLQATNPPALQLQLEREVKRLVRDHLGSEVTQVIVKPLFGALSWRIFESAREVNADLIVVGPHQRHGISRLFHGSVSRALLHEAGLNMVCVPTHAAFDPKEARIPEYHRVLVATDFSELGNAAIPFACGACCIGGIVRIIHVEKPARKTTSPVAAAEVRQRLRGLIPVATGARCQPPQVAVLEDRSPAAAICAEADRFGADLVCLASHGLGASRALHGSVTKAVLKKLRRPLLVIRRPDA